MAFPGLLIKPMKQPFFSPSFNQVGTFLIYASCHGKKVPYLGKLHFSEQHEVVQSPFFPCLGVSNMRASATYTIFMSWWDAHKEVVKKVIVEITGAQCSKPLQMSPLHRVTHQVVIRSFEENSFSPVHEISNEHISGLSQTTRVQEHLARELETCLNALSAASVRQNGSETSRLHWFIQLWLNGKWF